jgi:hypothetical protein
MYPLDHTHCFNITNEIPYTHWNGSWRITTGWYVRNCLFGMVRMTTRQEREVFKKKQGSNLNWVSCENSPQEVRKLKPKIMVLLIAEAEQVQSELKLIHIPTRRTRSWYCPYIPFRYNNYKNLPWSKDYW